MADPRHRSAPSVREQLDPAVQALGLVLEDVEVLRAGSQSVLRVVVDLPQDQPGSLSLDQVAEATHAISHVLDRADPMGESSYTLEVSSPGVERPLTAPRHLRRNIARLVRLTLRDGESVTGRIVAVDEDDAVLLLLPGAKKGMAATRQRQIAWEQIVQGVVQVEFNPPQDLSAQDLGQDAAPEPDDGES